LNIQSEYGTGTVVTVCIPLEKIDQTKHDS